MGAAAGDGHWIAKGNGLGGGFFVVWCDNNPFTFLWGGWSDNGVWECCELGCYAN
jgi:hypothetical protein